MSSFVVFKVEGAESNPEGSESDLDTDMEDAGQHSDDEDDDLLREWSKQYTK